MHGRRVCRFYSSGGESSVSESRALDLRDWKLRAAGEHEPPNTDQKRGMELRDKAPETVAGPS